MPYKLSWKQTVFSLAKTSWIVLNLPERMTNNKVSILLVKAFLDIYLLWTLWIVDKLCCGTSSIQDQSEKEKNWYCSNNYLFNINITRRCRIINIHLCIDSTGCKAIEEVKKDANTFLEEVLKSVHIIWFRRPLFLWIIGWFWRAVPQ